MTERTPDGAGGERQPIHPGYRDGPRTPAAGGHDARIRTDHSSRELKTDVEPVDGTAVLETVADLEVSEWSYAADPDGVRHLGPMAEDFHDAFGLGSDTEHVAPLDTGGVALAAIQGLREALDAREERIETQTREIDAQTARIDRLERENAEHEERVATLERLVDEADPFARQVDGGDR